MVLAREDNLVLVKSAPPQNVEISKPNNAISSVQWGAESVFFTKENVALV